MTDYHRKIVSIDRLRQIITEAHHPAVPDERGKTVVQCHGCFDIVHPGHIRYLEFAKSQGDVLVVSITGDGAMNKGALRPYIPQELRAENLAALESVDYVVIDPHATACALLDTLRPDVYVKGQEYATSQDPRFLAERQVVESYGGRVIFSSGQVIYSSSRLGEITSSADELAVQRLGVVCQRHGISRAGLSRFARAARGRRILVLGDVFVERYVLCDAGSIASESPMMSLTELDKKDYLGGAGIVAAQLAACGAETTLVTSLGQDGESTWAMKELADAGVQVQALRHRPYLPVTTRFLVDDHKVLKVERAASCPLDSVGEREAAEVLVAEAAKAHAGIVHDGGHGVVTAGLLQRVGPVLRQRLPLLVGATGGAHGNLAVLKQFDVLCTSERRLRLAMNDFGAGLSALAYHMLQRTQAKRILVTLGKRGLVIFDRRSHDRQSAAWGDRLYSEYLPSFADRVHDRLGCSESVLALSSLALAAGADFIHAAYMASAAAAIQIGLPGLQAIGASDLELWLRGRPELADTESFEASLRESCAAAAGLVHELNAV